MKLIMWWALNLPIAKAYKADAAQALRLSATFSKDFSADTRLINISDSGLDNQMAFLMMEVPNGPATLAVLPCPFPTANGTEAVLAGSLGEAMDLICPVTICFSHAQCQRTVHHYWSSEEHPNFSWSRHFSIWPAERKSPCSWWRHDRWASKTRLFTSQDQQSKWCTMHCPPANNLSTLRSI